MKARVKGTTAIIDVTFDKNALNEGYPPYKAGGGIYYYPEQLVWVDNIDSVDPDYWEKLKHQYAGMAMQGILSSDKILGIFGMQKGKELDDMIGDMSVKIATTLVNRLKEGEK